MNEEAFRSPWLLRDQIKMYDNYCPVLNPHATFQPRRINTTETSRSAPTTNQSALLPFRPPQQQSLRHSAETLQQQQNPSIQQIENEAPGDDCFSMSFLRPRPPTGHYNASRSLRKITSAGSGILTETQSAAPTVSCYITRSSHEEELHLRTQQLIELFQSKLRGTSQEAPNEQGAPQSIEIDSHHSIHKTVQGHPHNPLDADPIFVKAKENLSLREKSLKSELSAVEREINFLLQFVDKKSTKSEDVGIKVFREGDLMEASHQAAALKKDTQRMLSVMKTVESLVKGSKKGACVALPPTLRNSGGLAIPEISTPQSNLALSTPSDSNATTSNHTRKPSYADTEGEGYLEDEHNRDGGNKDLQILKRSPPQSPPVQPFDVPHPSPSNYNRRTSKWNGNVTGHEEHKRPHGAHESNTNKLRDPEPSVSPSHNTHRRSTIAYQKAISRRTSAYTGEHRNRSSSKESSSSPSNRAQIAQGGDDPLPASPKRESIKGNKPLTGDDSHVLLKRMQSMSNGPGMNNSTVTTKSLSQFEHTTSGHAQSKNQWFAKVNAVSAISNSRKRSIQNTRTHQALDLMPGGPQQTVLLGMDDDTGSTQRNSSKLTDTTPIESLLTAGEWELVRGLEGVAKSCHEDVVLCEKRIQALEASFVAGGSSRQEGLRADIMLELSDADEALQSMKANHEKISGEFMTALSQVEILSSGSMKDKLLILADFMDLAEEEEKITNAMPKSPLADVLAPSRGRVSSITEEGQSLASDTLRMLRQRKSIMSAPVVKKSVGVQNNRELEQKGELSNRIHRLFQHERLIRTEVRNLKTAIANVCTFADNMEVALSCKVCLNAFTNPVLVKPCGHSACSECFERLVLTGTGEVECPECGRECEEGSIQNGLLQVVAARWIYKDTSTKDLDDVMASLTKEFTSIERCMDEESDFLITFARMLNK